MTKKCPKCHCQVPEENKFCVCMYNFETGLTLKQTRDGVKGDDIIELLTNIMGGKNETR